MDVEKIVDRLLSGRSQEVVDLCQSLVRIPSEEPPGNTIEIASFIHSVFQREGIESEMVGSNPDKPNVIARITGNGDGPHLVFNGHMDTFPVPDRSRWSFEPFGGEIVDGKLYGRGAADMKGGLACCIQSVIMLHELRDLFPGRVSITCVSDEEVGGQGGSRFLLKTYPDLYGDALINGEPSSPDNIRIGEKGQYWYRICCSTKGGHAAYAGLKHNAISKLWNFFEDLLTFNEEQLTAPSSVVAMMKEAKDCYDGLLGPGSTEAALRQSINIGNIRGGASVNMIPEYCEAEIDFRLPPGETGDGLEVWIKEKELNHPCCEITKFKSEDATLTDPSHPLVRTIKIAAEEVRGHKVFTTYSLGGTEARLWRSRGVPAVTYGPNHHNMASADEYILIEDILDVVKAQTLGAFRYLRNCVGRIDQ